MKKLLPPKLLPWLLGWALLPGAALIVAYFTGSFWTRILQGSNEPHFFYGASFVFIVALFVVPVISIVALAAVLAVLIRKESVWRTIQILLIGLVAQLFFVALLIFVRFIILEGGIDVETLPILLLGSSQLFLLPTLIVQVIFAGIALGLAKIKALPRWSVVVIALVVTALIAVGIRSAMGWYAEQRHEQAAMEQEQQEEAIRAQENAYRESARSPEFSLLKSRRLFQRKDGSLVAVAPWGEEEPLKHRTILEGREPDTEVFLDLYQDLIFYRTADRSVMRYSLETGKAEKLTGEIETYVTTPACHDEFDTEDCKYFPRVKGAHGPYVILDRGIYAASTNVAAFDMRTGERVTMSSYAGYDYRRVYQFWVDGQGYHLIINALTEPQTAPVMKSGGVAQRTWQSGAGTMNFWIETFDGSPHEVPDEHFAIGRPGREYEIPPDIPWVDLAFSGGFPEYLEGRTPFFTLPTNKPLPERPGFGDNFDYFSVRGLYRLDAAHIGLEVSEGIVVIDLNAQTGSFVEDPETVERWLANAVPLAGDDWITGASGCPEYDDTRTREKEMEMEFLGCVY